jgi:6,7-dimethyl-8-ribityllumazine synthase
MASTAPASPVTTVEPTRRFAIAVARFNPHITGGLLRGARACLTAASVPEANITVVEVPGAFELPLAAQRLARSGEYDAVICLGCLIKGDTMHFEYIAHACTTGIAQVALDTGLPVAFGVLATLDEAQAVARAGEGRDNKGWEATQAALEMVAVLARLDAVTE